MKSVNKSEREFETLEMEHRETTREYALRCLIYNIARLNLLPGEAISEAKISELTGVSRTPVREAFFDLSNLGLVEIFPQRGTRVSFIDIEMVEQAQFMRLALESSLINSVIKTITDEQISTLRELIENQKDFAEKGDLAAFLDCDNEFHRQFFIFEKKELAYGIIKKLMVHFDRVRMLNLLDMDPSRSIAEHSELVDYLERGETKNALELIGKHLSHIKSDMLFLKEKHPSFFK